MKRFGLFAALMSLAPTAFAQSAILPKPAILPPSAAAKVEGGDRKVTFDSVKYWQDSRWLIVGEWTDHGSIRWLGGQETRFAFADKTCAPETGINVVVRPAETGKDKAVAAKAAGREIMQRRKWLAVEVSPDVVGETFEIRSPEYRNRPECIASVTVDYAWKNPKPVAKPLLFLKPREYFFGHEIELYVPDKPERANIQLDLYLGYWSGSFPNAAKKKSLSASQSDALSDASSSIKFLPAAVSRGEWLLPFYPRVGLSLALEQSLRSFGGAELQTMLLSDWFVGAFYQHMVAVGDGLQLRALVKYHEHLADQGSYYDTMASVNQHVKNLIVGGTANYYFSKRWLAGLDLEYGLPNHMAGRGASQSYLSYVARGGYRLTNFMLLMGELGMRNYAADGYDTESLMMANLGIRLEL